jgi:hypothetical protein
MGNNILPEIVDQMQNRKRKMRSGCNSLLEQKPMGKKRNSDQVEESNFLSPARLK